MSSDAKWNNVSQIVESQRSINLGQYYSYGIDNDIKHIGFVLSRYKFASKMAEYKEKLSVLELGCSYGLGSRFFSQLKGCQRFVGVDFDEKAIAFATETFNESGLRDVMFVEDNFLNKTYIQYNDNKKFDMIVSLDVIEHIEKDKEQLFVRTVEKNLSDAGIAIIGTPNISMSPYASETSRIGHVNLYDHKRLYDLMSCYFRNVFMFSMNDEVVHTGFAPMSCYIFAVCCGIKN